MGESRRSAACANELHAQCPHLMGLRVSGDFLCRCACHLSCPVSGGDTAALDAWWDACACPGSDWQRDKGRRRWHSDQPPTMPELEQQLRAQESARARARAHLAGQVRGLSTEQVRQLLVAELRAQGAELPARSVLDREAERIRRAVPPDAGLLRTARSLASQYRQMRSSSRQLRSHVRNAQALQGPHGEQPYVSFDTDYSLPAARVAADQQALAQLAYPDGDVYVSLLPQAGTSSSRVAVLIDEHQVGVLPAADGARYQPSLAAARDKSTVLMVRGVIESTPDDERQLHISPAGII